MVVVDDVGGGALTTKSSDKQTRRDAYRHAWTKCVTSRNASAPASLALQTLSYLCYLLCYTCSCCHRERSSIG